VSDPRTRYRNPTTTVARRFSSEDWTRRRRNTS
jgi:hypothetical protein